MSNEFQIEIKPIHHADCLIIYKDALGELEIAACGTYLEGVDLISTMGDLGVEGERRTQVLAHLYAWAKDQNFNLLIWKK